MSAGDYHLTPIGNGNFLLEPGPALEVGRPEAALESIIARLQGGGAAAVYYDLAELSVIDAVYYDWLNLLARACKTINVRMVCLHMQPTAAFALTQAIQRRPDFETALHISQSQKASA